VFQKELFNNGIPNVTVWWVLRKLLYLKAYKLSIALSMWRVLRKLLYLKAYELSIALSINVFVSTRHTVTFGITLLRSTFWNTLHYQLRSHWTITIPGKIRCVLLHCGSSKHCTFHLNTFILAFDVVKLFLIHPVYVHCLKFVWRKATSSLFRRLPATSKPRAPHFTGLSYLQFP
jgi:hypothetical protein